MLYTTGFRFALPSDHPSMVTKLMVGLAAAIALASATKLKPTANVISQLWSTIACKFGAKSSAEFDSASAICDPRSASAFSRPSYTDSLNDLSFQLPSSETAQAK